MAKPELIPESKITPLFLQRYEHYLPTAFNESMTLLQKVNKVIHELWRIGELTNDMIEKWNEVIRWILNEGLEDAVEDKLDEWLKDGTIDKIINENLFNDLKRMIQELYDRENEFDIRDIQPDFISNLGGLRNAVNQSIHVHPTTLDLYVTQSDSKSPEGFYITKLTPSGHYDSAMLLPEGGHGTSIGIDHSRSGENPYIWTYHLKHRKLVRFSYEDNVVLSDGEVATMTDFTPPSLKDAYFSVSYDPYHDLLCFRIEDGRVQVRKRTDVLNRIDNVLYRCTIPASERNSERPMQGCINYGQYIYYQSGTSAMNNRIKIFKYDGKTGEQLFEHEVNDLVAEQGMYEFRDNFKEPEGMAYYVHPKTKKQSLLFVITSGGGNKRYHMLYAFNQRDAGDHWDSIARLGAQGYAFTRGDGRTLALPEGTTSLDDVTKPGIYYITNGEAQNLHGFPYPLGTAGWELYVSPMNQVFSINQTLKRMSGTRQIKAFERNLAFDRETFRWTAGKWTVHMKGGQNQEYLEASEWGNKLSNVLFAGEYYLTGNQGSEFTDFDHEGAGWRLYVSSADSEGVVRQTAERNSMEHFHYKIRHVDVDTKQATGWKTIKLVPEA